MFKEKLKNWKTTILGLIPMLIGVLGLVGVIDPANQAEVTEGANEAVGGLFDLAAHGFDWVMIVLGLGLFNSKDDSNKDTE